MARTERWVVRQVGLSVRRDLAYFDLPGSHAARGRPIGDTLRECPGGVLGLEHDQRRTVIFGQCYPVASDEAGHARNLRHQPSQLTPGRGLAFVEPCRDDNCVHDRSLWVERTRSCGTLSLASHMASLILSHRFRFFLAVKSDRATGER